MTNYTINKLYAAVIEVSRQEIANWHNRRTQAALNTLTLEELLRVSIRVHKKAKL